MQSSLKVTIRIVESIGRIASYVPLSTFERFLTEVLTWLLSTIKVHPDDLGLVCVVASSRILCSIIKSGNGRSIVLVKKIVEMLSCLVEDTYFVSSSSPVVAPSGQNLDTMKEDLTGQIQLCALEMLKYVLVLINGLQKRDFGEHFQIVAVTLKRILLKPIIFEEDNLVQAGAKELLKIIELE